MVVFDQTSLVLGQDTGLIGMKKRYMFFVIFFLESCDLKLNPSVEFHAFHFSDGSLSTEKNFCGSEFKSSYCCE
jgi:hypothetical protein